MHNTVLLQDGFSCICISLEFLITIILRSRITNPLRCVGTPLCFHVVFRKGNNFCKFHFTFLGNEALSKEVSLNGTSLLLRSKLFAFRRKIDLIQSSNNIVGFDTISPFFPALNLVVRI